MNLRRLTIALASAATLLVPAAASAEWNDSIRYHGEVAAAFGGGEHNPFWLSANKYGLSSVNKNNAMLRLGAFHDLDKNKRFSWGAGVDLAVAANYSRVFIPQQVYAEVKYRCLNAMIGKKEIPDEVVNSDLSSGALTYSGNAEPIPQIRVGIFDYADFWGCNGWFAVKGHIAYGAYADNCWLKDWVNVNAGAPGQYGNYAYTLNNKYCSRAIYFRGGNDNKFPLSGELGLEMATQFGGTSYYLADVTNPETGQTEQVLKSHKHPEYLKAWLKALIPMSGGADTSWGEQNNVEGNYLGNWSFSLKWNDPRGWMVRIYYQHFFEDHSMLFFDYPWKDGLYGVEARLPKNPFVSEIVGELLYTRDQSGPVYWDHTPSLDVQISERDNYYNHYIYNGWQNFGMGMGNPLLISPIYNANHAMYFYSTRLVAYHLGFKGNPTPQIGYRVKATYLDSWGTYAHPYREIKKNFSLLAEVKWHPARLKGWEGTLSFGMDGGSLIGHSYGAAISISKTGWLFAPKKKK